MSSGEQNFLFHRENKFYKKRETLNNTIKNDIKCLFERDILKKEGIINELFCRRL